MSDEAQRFLLQVIALITGGGIVQLIVHLLKRRSEMRALDKTSTAPLLDSAQGLIDRYTQSEQRAHERVDRIQSELEKQKRDHTNAMGQLQEENQRMARMVSQLRTDLEIANGQIQQLSRDNQWLRERLQDRGHSQH